MHHVRKVPLAQGLARKQQKQRRKAQPMQTINDFVNSLVIRAMAARDKEDGQTLVEYALIIALMSIALVVSLEALAGGVDKVFDDIIAKL